MELSDFDKKVLNVLQTQLPIEPHPFMRIAEAVNSTAEEVLSRIQLLKENGYIRRIGPFFDSTRLGFKGTLVAAEVAPEHLESVAQAINRYVGVTHNYEREGTFNLWFTLLSDSEELQRKTLSEIAALPGVKRLNSLPAKKKYKVSVQFKLK